MRNHSCKKVLDLQVRFHKKKKTINSFSYERFSKKTPFETEGTR